MATRLNVYAGRLEADDEYEEGLLAQIARAEQERRDAMARRADRWSQRWYRSKPL